MDGRHGAIASPDSENVKDCFVGRIILGQQVPVTSSPGEVEQRVDDEEQGSSWSAGPSGLGQHGFQIGPLGVGKVGSEICILDRLETRCRGDVAVSGWGRSQWQSTELRDFPELSAELVAGGFQTDSKFAFPMVTRRLIVVGAGGHGRIVAEAARISGLWKVISFGDDDPAKAGRVIDGVVVGLWRSREVDGSIVVAIGDNRIRKAIFAEACSLGLPIGIVVHPRAQVSPGASLGDGSVVLAGAIVQMGARVGRNVIINAGAVIDHDVEVGDHAHIGLNATVCSRAKVGAGERIAPGSVIVSLTS